MQFDQLKRREFITLLTGAALTRCLGAIQPAFAQGVVPQAAHIGFISGVDAAAAAGFARAGHARRDGNV
jgi:hypothetical protein